MIKKDWTLLTIAAAEGSPLGPVQLQKCLFLLDRMKLATVDKDSFYEFAPYHYGPFSREIYRDADDLERSGLIMISRDGAVRQYRASSHGLKRAEQLRGETDPSTVDYLGRVVEWARSLSFQDLVRAIYAEFPEYKQNSVFEG